MKQSPEEKHFLNLAGEFGVCAELFKRNIHANLTYGNHKATDIIVITNKQSFSIEVKTSMTNRIVTSFFQKFHTPEISHPDFWVIVHINANNLQSEFYVLTHNEMAKEQMKRNGMTEWHKITGGVDNVLLSQLESYKNKWETIFNNLL